MVTDSPQKRFVMNNAAQTMLCQEKPKALKKARISKSGFKTAKLATLIASKGVRLYCISAYPGLSHQKNKRKTTDALKSQLNQAR